MSTIFLILISTFIISLISFVGALTLILKDKLLDRIILILISLSAGVLMSTSFLHIIPESLEKLLPSKVFVCILLGFVFFFFLEKVLQWRHCHKGNCDVHPFAYMNLFGDAVHNFVDGTIIAASFVVSYQLGFVTTLAVALHEIPQELGEFGVLIYGGFKKAKALLFNFISALMAMLGGILGFFFSSYLNYPLVVLLPFAAGGFIYIAASDLIPEIRKESGLKNSFLCMVTFVLGMLIIYFIKNFGFN